MPQHGQDYSADAVSSASFLPLQPSVPVSEPRPPVVSVVVRLPHLGETERPSILPLRHDPLHDEVDCCGAMAKGDSDRLVFSFSLPLARNISARLCEQSRWIYDRLIHDRLLLGSWICIAILGVIVATDFIGERFFSRRPKADISGDSVLVLQETPWISETAIIANNTDDTREIRPSNPFAAVTIDNGSDNASTEPSWAKAATPWDKPVASAYAPWKVATNKPTTEAVATTAPSATTPSTAAGLISSDVYRVAAREQNAAPTYEPTGFSGYNPVTPIAAPPTEREVPMRPATPIAPMVQQPLPAWSTGMGNGAIPVTESRQTFRRDVTPQPVPVQQPAYPHGR